MLNINEILKKYLDGYNCVEIAKIFNCNKKTIQGRLNNFKKRISEKELKNIETVHKRNRDIVKDIKATESREVNKFMCEITFIKTNSSIYITDTNGNIKINKTVAPIVTYDTPKRMNIKRISGQITKGTEINEKDVEFLLDSLKATDITKLCELDKEKLYEKIKVLEDMICRKDYIKEIRDREKNKKR